MTDYSKMSNDEINDLVIDRLVASGDLTYDHDDCSGKLYVSGGWCWGAGVKTNLFKDGKPFITHHNGRKLDFCNNPADAWPIIIENGISIVRLDKNWLCAPIDEAIDGITGDSEVCFYASKGVVDNKPFRAAMIVFLMMREESDGS